MRSITSIDLLIEPSLKRKYFLDRQKFKYIFSEKWSITNFGEKQMKSLQFLPLTAAILAFHSLLFSDAYAYIDPGSGSLIIQMLIGAIVGVGITLKLYWYKLKEAISTKLSRN